MVFPDAKKKEPSIHSQLLLSRNISIAMRVHYISIFFLDQQLFLEDTHSRPEQVTVIVSVSDNVLAFSKFIQTDVVKNGNLNP